MKLNDLLSEGYGGFPQYHTDMDREEAQVEGWVRQYGVDKTVEMVQSMFDAGKLDQVTAKRFMAQLGQLDPDVRDFQLRF